MAGLIVSSKGRGFTYMGVLIFVAIMGILLSALGTAWRTHVAREREEELLFVGHEYRKAIRRFADNTPAGARRYPSELSELLKDPRRPDTQRYLRKLYVDPITGSREWGLVRAPDGGIAGVYSLSGAQPLKTGNFTGENVSFEGREKYLEWQFTAIGATLPGIRQ
jgi:type II secretory pathway pseudopilin PulG